MEDKKIYPLTIKLPSEVSEELLPYLQEVSPLHTYESGSNLFYASQIPIVAYILVEGEITFIQNAKAPDHIQGITLIGLAQMVKGSSSHVSAIVTKKSKIYYLDKSQYKDLSSSSKTNNIKGILNDLLEIN